MSKAKIERGRTGSDLTPGQKDTEKGLVAGSREEAAHSPNRPARVSMHNTKKLEVPDSYLEAGYYHRWFKDRDGKIESAKAAYYEHATDENGNVRKITFKSDTLYLMKLKQKYRDEDLLLKKQRVSATLEQQAAIKPGEYAPNGGNSAITNTVSDNQYS